MGSASPEGCCPRGCPRGEFLPVQRGQQPFYERRRPVKTFAGVNAFFSFRSSAALRGNKEGPSRPGPFRRLGTGSALRSHACVALSSDPACASYRTGCPRTTHAIPPGRRKAPGDKRLFGCRSAQDNNPTYAADTGSPSCLLWFILLLRVRLRNAVPARSWVGKPVGTFSGGRIKS